MNKLFRLSRRDLIGLFCLIALLVGNAIFLSRNTFRCFNNYDMGTYLTASYRVYLGQRPFVDFSYISSPFHLYMNAFFFHLFGFGKTAILAHLLTVHSLVILMVYFSTSRRLPLLFSLLVTALAVPSFYWQVSHPWHDANAHFWGIIGVAAILWRNKGGTEFFSSQAVVPRAVVAGVAAVLSAMTKTNIGAAYGATFFLVFLAAPKRIRFLKWYIITGMIALIPFFLMVSNWPEFLEQMRLFVESQERVPERFSELKILRAYLRNYYWIPALIVLINFVLRVKRWKAYKELGILFWGVGFTGLFSALTGLMKKHANTFAWGMFMALAFILIFEMIRQDKKFWQRLIAGCSLIAFCWLTVFMTWIAVRQGQVLEVWTYIRPVADGTYPLKAEPLKGWMFYADEGPLIDEAVIFLNEHVPKQDSVLEMTLNHYMIIYPLAAREPYKHIPFQFQMNAFPIGEMIPQTANNILANPPDWIIIDAPAQESMLPLLKLDQYVNDHYEKVKDISGQLFILRLKQLER